MVSKIILSPVLWFLAIFIGVCIYMWVEKREFVYGLFNKKSKGEFKTCANCGEKNPPDHVFCEKCGTKFNE